MNGRETRLNKLMAPLWTSQWFNQVGFAFLSQIIWESNRDLQMTNVIYHSLNVDGDGGHWQGCHVSGKCQGKTKFSPEQGNQGILKTNVREIWPFDPCQGIVREFCHDIIFRLKLPSFDEGSSWVVFVCRCLLGKYKFKVYWSLLLNFCLSKILGVWGNYRIYQLKVVFSQIENKRNCQGKLILSWKCQGILNGLKCGNPDWGGPSYVLCNFILGHFSKAKTTSHLLRDDWVLFA